MTGRIESKWGVLLVPIVLNAGAGCASAPPLPPLPPLEAQQAVLAAEEASLLDRPYRLVFAWSLSEPGTRLEGRGVARIEPPFRARLDLFLENGEQAAAATLVDDRVVVVEGNRTQLPPAPFLWGVLGVFRPGEASQFLGGSSAGANLTELTYTPAGGGEIVYRLRDSRVQEIEVRSGGRSQEELQLLRSDGERFPREARYRHAGQVRELTVTLEAVENAETFPSEIWNPSR